MGCLVSCLACEAASCLCTGICKCCGRAVPMSKVAGRIMYTVMFFLMSFVAWIFHGWSKELLSKIPVLKRCTEIADGAASNQVPCYGTLAVYRISFVLAVFHIILALVMIGVKRHGDCRTSLQDGFWIIKLLFLIGGSVGVFFIPNPFFEYFGWVAFVAAAIFIVVQLLLLVDFAHTWAENWIGKLEAAEEGDKKWFVILLSTSAVMYAFSLGLTIVMAIFFCKDAGKCQRNVALLTLNIVFCFIVSVMSIHPKVQEKSPRSGLLQSSLITAYSTYLIFSAMMSSDDECNPWIKSSGANNTSVAIGAVFTIVAVCYTCIRAASTVGTMEPEEEHLVKEEGAKKEEKDEIEKEVENDEVVGYSFSKFHIVFALGAFYIAMLMSDWRTVYNPGHEDAKVDSGLAAVWVKVVSSWIGIALYIWTLIAPVALPNREWN
eukprot:TRINITY_DN465_c0_g1_i1.p1 TRINITY_DN465_c0_g1~~TRINITY_DN465_c0_g1_i1.p1  ORF type:complete len:434 (-),score=100.97 TRINITY_DN465_c0_g1_i1:50-1351(-)